MGQKLIAKQIAFRRSKKAIFKLIRVARTLKIAQKPQTKATKAFKSSIYRMDRQFACRDHKKVTLRRLLFKSHKPRRKAILSVLKIIIGVAANQQVNHRSTPEAAISKQIKVGRKKQVSKGKLPAFVCKKFSMKNLRVVVVQCAKIDQVWAHKLVIEQKNKIGRGRGRGRGLVKKIISLRVLQLRQCALPHTV